MIKYLLLDALYFGGYASSSLHESLTHPNTLVLEGLNNQTDKPAVQVLCCYRALLVHWIYLWGGVNVRGRWLSTGSLDLSVGGEELT